MRGNGNDRSPVTLSSNLVQSPLFNGFPTGPHSKGLGSTSSYTALPEPGNAGGRAEMRGSGNDRGPVTLICYHHCFLIANSCHALVAALSLLLICYHHSTLIANSCHALVAALAALSLLCSHHCILITTLSLLISFLCFFTTMLPLSCLYHCPPIAVLLSLHSHFCPLH